MIKRIVLFLAIAISLISQAAVFCVTTPRDQGKKISSRYRVTCDDGEIFETKSSLFSPKKAKENMLHEMYDVRGAVEEITFADGFHTLFVMNENIEFSSKSDYCIATYSSTTSMHGYTIECPGEELNHYKAREGVKMKVEITVLDNLTGKTPKIRARALAYLSNRLRQIMDELDFNLISKFETEGLYRSEAPVYLFIAKN